MDLNRSMWGVVLASGLAVAFAFLNSGCGSSSETAAPAEMNPEIEKKTQEMLKNKSQQYNERYRKNGGKPG